MRKKFSKNFKFLLKTMTKTEKQYYFYILANAFFTGMYSYGLICLPKVILSQLELTSLDFSELTALFICIVFGGLGAVAMKYLYTPLGYKIRYNLLAEVSEKMLTIPLSDFENPKNLDNIWNVTSSLTNPNGVQAFYLQLGNVFGNIAVILLSVILLAKINPIIILMIIGWTFFYIGMILYKNKKINQLTVTNATLYREQRYIQELSFEVNYAKEIRTLQLLSWVDKKRQQLYQKLLVIIKKTGNYTMITECISSIYQFLRDYFIYSLLIVLYFNQKLTLAEFSSYTVLIIRLNDSIMQLANNIDLMFNQFFSLDLLADYLSLETENHNQGRNIKTEEFCTIEFKDVSFHYPNTNRLILDKINLKIKRGSKAAIIGLNGAGKTTLIKLLMRLYQPTSGKILLNGVDIEEYCLSDYYRLFAPVFQDIPLFPFPLIENINLNTELADEEKINAVFQTVGLKDRINKLPNGLYSNMTRYLHEDGVLFSGGELQKFGLARALYYDRPILILDEPTAALDPVAEYEFYEKINRDFEEKTILFISHRLASTRFCDEIILLEDKNIKEKGTHEELMSLNGRYREIFNIQAKNYRSERTK